MQNHESHELIKQFADKVIARKLQAPVLIFVESCRPLAGVLFQLAIAFKPFISFIVGKENTEQILMLTKDPSAVEHFIECLNAQ